MSYEPLVYIKSFKERLEDFSILNTSLKACEVKAVWSSYIELSMMNDSLQAIWKVSREFCYDKEICYPCTVVVHVSTIQLCHNLRIKILYFIRHSLCYNVIEIVKLQYKDVTCCTRGVSRFSGTGTHSGRSVLVLEHVLLADPLPNFVPIL